MSTCQNSKKKFIRPMERYWTIYHKRNTKKMEYWPMLKYYLEFSLTKFDVWGMWSLCYELNHGLAIHHNVSSVLATAESIWDEISNNIPGKATYNFTERVKNSLWAITYNLIDSDKNHIFRDKKKHNNWNLTTELV